ncbi:metal/formaldehyde-sensitive transcriptional repressor [Xanthomonas euvesicatoria pv. allii]|uniref:metal/formaldehyde-sensitive transcriptional repressor n=1 Tax=Xanthomonas euvesicatoria TaxID=456327 RepID=UPI00240727CA|nr:metal/formaldehyde-sensitive transcriptional repressor [Xanthomonas euvesicatoria]MCP3050704.1 metal/formaldehyde-sensitive transcriptional repressor [Xanthomonas euvesicatoria pv. allii]
MGHIARNPKKLLTRVRRIGGQVAALEAALANQPDCTQVLIQIAAVRGAVHGLLIEVMNEHLQGHVASPGSATQRTAGADELAALMRTYLK